MDLLAALQICTTSYFRLQIFFYIISGNFIYLATFILFIQLNLKKIYYAKWVLSFLICNTNGKNPVHFTTFFFWLIYLLIITMFFPTKKITHIFAHRSIFIAFYCSLQHHHHIVKIYKVFDIVKLCIAQGESFWNDRFPPPALLSLATPTSVQR